MLKNVLVAIASVLVSLLLLEIGLRVYSAFSFPKMMVLDDQLGWKHAPNVTKIFVNEYGEKIRIVQNAHGHRGKYYDFTKSPGKYRILVLGDSFAEGGEVNERDLFSACLERLNSRLEVVNAGVSGYGTVQEYLYLKKEGLKLNPDLVLLMFYENDLTDNCLSYFFPFGPRPYAILNNAGVEISETLDPAAYRKFIFPVPFRMTLNRHSYLYYFLNSRIYYQLGREKMQRLHAADVAAIGDQKYTIFFELAKLINDLLVVQKIAFAVLLIPTREEAAAGFSSTLEAIGTFCQSNRIQCISLLERFKQEIDSGERLYFPVDFHWTKGGHRVAAEEINRQLLN